MSKIVGLFLLAMQPLLARVQQIDTLTPFVEATATCTEKSLVVFDVDRVLIDLEDAILRQPNRQLLQRLKLHHTRHLSPAEVNDLLSTIYLQAKSMLIDPASVSLIKNLKSRSIPVIALTATQIGGFGKIASIQDWRVQDLEGLGISFATSFPKHPFLLLPDVNGQGPVPVFKEGILFSATYPKGEVLKAFLQTIHFQPDKVFFIDDLRYNIQSVENVLQQMGIQEVHTFHYLGAEQIPNSINPQIAEFQFKTLVEKGEWVGDQATSLPLR